MAAIDNLTSNVSALASAVSDNATKTGALIASIKSGASDEVIQAQADALAQSTVALQATSAAVVAATKP